MKPPSKAQIARLPRWAQDYIEQVERQREAAIRALDNFNDEQAPSKVWVDDMVCERDGGPVTRRRYVQSNHVTFENGGVFLDVYLREDDAIDLQYGGGPARGFGGDALLVPRSYQNLQIRAVRTAR